MSIENAERDIEIRRVSFGEGENNKLDVPVIKRENGSARPRYMLAEVGVHDFIDVIGSPQYYYGTEMEYARREDTAADVAKAIGAGIVELVEVVMNKGRIPKAERTLTRKQRKEMKNQAREMSDSTFEPPSNSFEGEVLTGMELDTPVNLRLGNGGEMPSIANLGQ